MLYPQQNDFRNLLDISGIWDFQTDPDEIGEKEGWYHGLDAARPLAVPGSWNEMYDDLFNYFGMGWYVRQVYAPQAWKGQRVYLRVGSACYWAAVWVNGVKVGEHEGGHLPFAFEITHLLQWDAPNTVAIQVENHLKPTRVPSGNMSMAVGGMFDGFPKTTYDFFPFCGIHRPVLLYSLPQAAIEDISVSTDITGNDASVRVKVKITTAQESGVATLAGGKWQQKIALQFKDGWADVTMNVPNAQLWSPEHPFLYDLNVTLNGKDRYALKVGIRTVVVQGKQILLNGKPVHLNGYGRHEDFIASGKGLNLPLLVKDYHLMRWTGANSYRTSHYPYSEEEMMLADRAGFLIIDEIPAVSLHFDNPENIAIRLKMCLQQIEELVARDKNHPSVVMWSVANEPMLPNMMARLSGKDKSPIDPATTEFFKTLIDRTRQLDATRPVTLVGMMGGPMEWLQLADVTCINRYWGWYVMGGQLDKGLAALEQELDALWDVLKKPVIVTEFGADTVSGLHGHPSVMWSEEYQADFIRGYLTVAARKDFVAGMHVWNFADFAAVQTPGRVGGMNLKGVFTRTRQPKMAAHVLREFWAKPVQPAEQPAQPKGIRSMLLGLVRVLDGKNPGLNRTLKFDIEAEGIYRLVIQNGAVTLQEGDGEAEAAMQADSDALAKIFTGQLDPMVAVMTGKVKMKGDPRAFMVLLSLMK